MCRGTYPAGGPYPRCIYSRRTLPTVHIQQELPHNLSWTSRRDLQTSPGPAGERPVYLPRYPRSMYSPRVYSLSWTLCRCTLLDIPPYRHPVDHVPLCVHRPMCQNCTFGGPPGGCSGLKGGPGEAGGKTGTRRREEKRPAHNGVEEKEAKSHQKCLKPPPK